MLKIGIDAHGVGGHSFGLGNETYFGNLIASLLKIDRRNEYHVFANYPDAIHEMIGDPPNAKVVSLRPHSQWLQRPLSVPIYANMHGLDLLHFPFVRPPMVRSKTIITVHDANYELFPGDFTSIERWRMKLLVPPSCRKADLVFTVSEFTRQELHEIYRIPLEKIVVTYNAGDHFGKRNSATPKALSFPKPYILFVGMIQPKKNLVRLVKAFDLLKSRGDLPHNLVVAGTWGWRNAELQTVLDSLAHRDKIHFPGYLTPKQVEAAMSSAEIFVFPSLYESFGIPPLEAQRLGVPVVVSNSTCFPEIYGDSAIYCDPYSVESIADAMEKLLRDPSLRADLSQRGLVRAQRYSWDKSARVALDAYERLFEQSAQPVNSEEVLSTR